MKKKIKVILVIAFVALLSFGFSVQAESKESKTDGEIYKEVYDDSGLSELTDSLSDETVETLNSLGVDLNDYNSFLSFSLDGVLKTFYSFTFDNLKAPLAVLAVGFALLAITATVGGMWNTKQAAAETYKYVCVLSLLTVVLMPVMSTVSACLNAVRAACTFMLGFVPVYTGILLYSGGVATGTVYQSVMLLVCEIVSQAFSFVVSPLVSAYVCLGVSSAVSGIDGAAKIAERVKNAGNVVVGFIMTVFTGFLSVQSAVAKSADSLSLKTARFFVSGTVPVVGGALSEALATVTAGVSLLRSSAFSWCVLVLGIIVLPVVVKLFLWRIVLCLLSAVSEMLGLSEPVGLFGTLSAALGLLVGITLSVTVMFILSLTVVRQVV